MNDLQTSLLAIGGVVIAGVVIFNWFQERGFRRKTERAFNRKHDDVLMLDPEKAQIDDLSETEPFIPNALEESTLDKPSYETNTPIAKGGGTESLSDPTTWCDSTIDYVVEFEATSPVSARTIQEVLHDSKEIGKPVSCIGQNMETSQWENVGLNLAANYQSLKVAIQLANRTGPITSVQLSNFRDIVTNLGVQIGAPINLPDSQSAISKAQEIDQFYADVDVSIVFNIISRSESSFSATRIRALAESMGFRLESDGEFYYYDDHEHTLFTLSNSEPTKFLPENIKNISTKCFNLTFEVPVVTDGLSVFDRLVQFAKNFTTSLGGLLVDDNYVPLNDSGIEKIKRQLSKIYDSMEEHRTRPGSARAGRLFS